MTELIRRETAIAWDLRLRSLRGRETAIALDAPPLALPGGTLTDPNLRGYVVGVSATGRTAEFDDARWPEPVVVAIEQVRSTRTPHWHEDGEDLVRSGFAARWRRRSDPDPYPGQLRLGGEAPRVSRRSREAVERASAMLLPADLMETLGALDAAVRRRSAVTSGAVAEKLGRSTQWTVRRLARLAEMKLAATSKNGDGRYRWAPGE